MAESKSSRFLTPKQFSDMTDGVVSVEQVWKLARKRALRHLRVGRRIFLYRAEIETWLERGGTYDEAVGGGR